MQTPEIQVGVHSAAPSQTIAVSVNSKGERVKRVVTRVPLREVYQVEAETE
jgi:hypothetical protein